MLKNSAFRFLLKLANPRLPRVAIAHLLSIRSIKKFIYYLNNYGIRNGLNTVLGRLQMAPEINSLSIPHISSLVETNTNSAIQVKISVVIPTRNAGTGFSDLLKSLKNQKGIEQVEIIIVDSGSTDHTLDIAYKEGAEIIEIPSADFHHAFARNRGAQLASGDYILFTVQDALPQSDHLLWDMARVFGSNNVVAVSCAEQPRPDCDLFYRCLMWNHYRALFLDRDRFLAWDESCASHFGLRANSQISNIALLIRRDVFLCYQFKTKFAEDLDLGVRLIRDGHKMGFLYSTAIVHSHNRPAYYFLKRAYVEAKYWMDIFPDYRFPPIDSGQKLFHDFAALYFRTKSLSRILKSKESAKIDDLSRFINQIREHFLVNDNFEESIAGCPDDDLESFVHGIQTAVSHSRVVYRYKENMVRVPLLNNLELLHEYIFQKQVVTDGSLVREIMDAMLKMLALVGGTHLAYLHLTIGKNKSSKELPYDLDKTLCLGV